MPESPACTSKNIWGNSYWGKNLYPQCLDESVLVKVANATISKEAWRFCKVLSKVRQSEDVLTSNITRVLAIVNKIKRYRETLLDIRLIDKIVRSLVPKFDYVACVIESKDLDSMTIEQVMGQLQTKEDKFKRRQDKFLEYVLKSKVFLKDNQEEKSQKVRLRRWIRTWAQLWPSDHAAVCLHRC
ncbi:hypothetical protein J1N35_044716 [Gossypium stocksii]|uniref:Uncharacterized protein n=1 Tax=Gossypium stocksii TaxID=47602 RepID=A0A9D3ZGI7_9ROSI|nr:hypothetical protein J1N35_044716 [Gossypium stocksii]